MKFQGALVREQGVVFGIIIVKPHVLQSTAQKESMVRFGEQAFGLVPIVLMAQDARGIPVYFGRRDIVQFLARVPLRAIPWKQYTIS